MPLKSVFLFALYTFVMASPGLVLAQQNCEALKDLKLEHAVVVSATLQEPAPLELPPGFPFKVPDVNVPRHCEVRAIARPTSDSEIGFTVWLPQSGSWNGKYMQRGNGGWAGSVPLMSLFAPLARGYAVSGTDDGHGTQGMIPDASWAIGHPEKLVDFGYRALHETATLSKDIMDAYYGKPAEHSYFFGCSDGGREAPWRRSATPRISTASSPVPRQTSGRIT